MKNDKVHLLHNMLMHLCYRRKKNLECWKKKHTKTYWWGLCFISPSVKIYGFSFIASVADSPHMHHVKPVIICISCCDRCYLMYTQGWCGWTVRCHFLHTLHLWHFKWQSCLIEIWFSLFLGHYRSTGSWFENDVPLASLICMLFITRVHELTSWRRSSGYMWKDRQ